MRTGLLYRLAVVAAVLAAVGVFAAPAIAAGAGEKDQTGFMGIKSYDLAIYTLVVFGLLFFVLGKYAWGPIMQGLEKREVAINQARTEAEVARAEAQKLLDEVKAQKASASTEIAGLLAEARRDAAELRETERARASADIQADRERLKREIETARDTALKEIWEKTVELAALVSTKAVRRELTADDHRRLIDEALAELQQNVGKA